GQRLSRGEAPQRIREAQWVDQVRVGTFLYAAEAHVARAKLVAHGIPAVVLDEHLVATYWLYSQALGGVTLYVPSAPGEAPVALLERDGSEALRGLPESSLPPAPDELCPNCGAAAAGRSLVHRLSRAPSLV